MFCAFRDLFSVQFFFPRLLFFVSWAVGMCVERRAPTWTTSDDDTTVEETLGTTPV
jgi:hypothetical protein